MDDDLEEEKSVKKPLWRRVFCWKSGVICLETTAVILLLLMLTIVVGFWAMTKNPLEVGFAKPYIEKALRNEERGVYGTMDKVVVHWPDITGPVYLGFSGTEIVTDSGKTILSIDEAAISLSKAKLLIGQIEPVAIILKKPTLHLIRTPENDIEIGFTDAGEESEKIAEEHVEHQTALTTRIFQYIARPGQEPDQSSPLASLEGFEINEAKLFVDDELLGMTWYLPRFDIAFLSTEEGVEADLHLELPTEEENVSVVDGGFRMIWDSKDVVAKADFKNIDIGYLSTKIPELEILQGQDLMLNGAVEAALDGNLNPKAVKLSLVSNQGALQIEDWSLEPVPYKDFKFDVFYDGAKKALDVQQLTITAKDVTVGASANFTQDENKISGPIDVVIKDLPQEKIGPIWPEALKDDNSRVWVVENITGGIYTHAEANMTLVAEKDEAGEWDVDAQDMTAAFEFEDMNVNYRPPLTPVTQSKGKGIFNYDEEKLLVTVESAKVGDMDMLSGDVELVNIIQAGKGVATVKTKLQGSVESMLGYTLNEPISLGDKIDFAVEETEGAATIDAVVSLPTVAGVKMSDVSIDITGTVEDAYVPDVVQGLALSGGPLALKITDESAHISGKGLLADRPIDFTWMEYIDSEGKDYTGKITAKIKADPNLRQHFGIVLDEFLTGTVPVDVTYTQYKGGKSVADIKADVTPVRLNFDPFDYIKEPGKPGNASLKASLVNGELKDVVNLVAAAPDFKLEKTDLRFRGAGDETELAAGNISRFTLGETVAGVEFEITPAGQIKLAMNGPFLDLRPFLGTDAEEGKQPVYDDPPMVASVAVDQMRTSEGQIVQYGKIYVDVNSKGEVNQLELDADIGTGGFYLRFKPDDTGMRVFRLEADDAGATLRAFGLYKKIQGGTLVVYAEPIRGIFDRNLIGKAEINNFKVVNAPALAQLLGLLSLQGIADLLGDEGVSFTKLEADIDWLYRREGSLFVMKEGRTSGGSLGLTFDGVYDQAKGLIDVSGTIVPMSGLNSVIGSIPLLGDILTGGSGGVFAATYTIKGDAKEPDISVNPLAVLAPGILRSILFE